ncbi:hypothetical protein VNO78_19644 [Psophocarpus tetragonolobus]|uniref:Uncharacterized protein n=1 Tax=Psophocarpus tetragonolobus TaxID=3891 RepID=A0AAN9S8G7_PSOTE
MRDEGWRMVQKGRLGRVNEAKVGLPSKELKGESNSKGANTGRNGRVPTVNLFYKFEANEKGQQRLVTLKAEKLNGGFREKSLVPIQNSTPKSCFGSDTCNGNDIELEPNLPQKFVETIVDKGGEEQSVKVTLNFLPSRSNFRWEASN